MSLGGYKFRGYYCQKGSLTDAQWAKKIHETKVTAFMAANTAANAGWQYDMTSSPDGNIHCLDSVGNNYVTVFKRTNGENDYTWFALYTLSQTTTSTETGYVAITTYRSYLGTSTNYYVGGGCSNFARIGHAAISYSDSLNSDISGTSLLFPLGNPCSTSYPGPTNSLMNCTSAYFGCAVKQKDIIIFSGKDNSSSLCVSIVSGNAFSSFYNDNDSNGCLIFNIQQMSPTGSNNYEMNPRTLAGSYLGGFCIAFNNNDIGSVNYCKLFVTPMAQYEGAVQYYPFQSLQMTAVPNSVTHIIGKGTLNIDLIAFNTQNVGSSGAPAIFSTVANGKLLTVVSGVEWTSQAMIRQLNRITLSGSYVQNYLGYPALYVGWDPSNPDITQASAWTEYTGA